MAKRPVPVNRERPFTLDSLFFSTTDVKGRITGCNDVFSDIAAYPGPELLGRAHSIVRHPDMPRCVFRLLWDSLLVGKPLGAYVKNLAQTGEYYWVYAVACPIEGGFLSVRLKPTSALFEKIPALYQALLETERSFGADREAGMAAGAQQLQRVLSELGYRDYTQFMAVALHQETLARRQKTRNAEDEGAEPSGWEAAVTDVERLFEASATLGSHVKNFEKFGIAVSRIALNTSVAASKLPEEGAALSVIAQHISGLANDVELEATTVGRLTTSLEESLFDTAFQISFCSLVREMMAYYSSSEYLQSMSSLQQLARYGGTEESFLTMLSESYARSIKRCRENAELLSLSAGAFRVENLELTKMATNLQLGCISGKMICARTRHGAHLAELLDRVTSFSLQLREDLGTQIECVRVLEHCVKRWQHDRIFALSSSQKNAA